MKSLKIQRVKKPKNINDIKTNKSKKVLIMSSVKTEKKNIKLKDNSSSIKRMKTSERDIVNQINNFDKDEKLHTNKENSYKILNIVNKNTEKGKNSKKKLKLKNNELLTKSNDGKNKIKNKENLITQNNTNNSNEQKDDKKKINNTDLNFICINLNLSRKKKYIPQDSHITLYNYTMEESFKYDRRELCEIFYIFLLSKQAVFHAFFYWSPLVVFPLRLCLLLFIISSDLALNAFFYFNDNISEKYRNTKNIFAFTFTTNITVILLSTLVGFVFSSLFTKLSNSTKAIRDVFKSEEEKLKKNKKYVVTEKRKIEIQKEIENILKKYKIKIICLISIELIFMLFFWYYVVSFCHVFSSTQVSWILDSLFSMLIRVIIDALLCFGLAKLYRIAVSAEICCLYKVVLFLYAFD